MNQKESAGSAWHREQISRWTIEPGCGHLFIQIYREEKMIVRSVQLSLLDAVPGKNPGNAPLHQLARQEAQWITDGNFFSLCQSLLK